MTSNVKETGTFFAPFGLGSRELVSLVGGGGKTTLLQALGEHLRRRGTVLLTTTTKMAPGPLPLLFVEEAALTEGADRIRAALSGPDYPLILAARRHVRDGDREKLEGLSPEAIDRLVNQDRKSVV